MAATNEREILERLATQSLQLRPDLSSEELAARHAIQTLRLSFEGFPNSGRRAACLLAFRHWRNLRGELQGKYVGLLSGIWSYHLLTNRPQRIQGTHRLLARLAERYQSTALQAESLHALGMFHLAHGHFAEAIDTLELCRALFATTGENAIDDARVSILLSSAHRLSGDHRSAFALLQRARTQCLKEEDASLLASVSLNLGLLFIESCDLTAATNAFEFVTESSRALGAKKRFIRGTLGLAMSHLRAGQIELAHQNAALGLRMAQEYQLVRESALAHEFFGEIATLRKNWVLGLRHFSLAAKLAATSKAAPDVRVELHRKIAEMWLRYGDDHYAMIHIRKGLALAGTGAIAEDLLALKRSSIEVDWLNGSDSAREDLEKHFEEVQRNGFGYEALMTAVRIASIAASLHLPELAQRWRVRAHVLADTCGASELLCRWHSDWSGDNTESSTKPASLENSTTSSSNSLQTVRFLSDLPEVNLAGQGIITSSEILSEQASWIARVAPTTVPVLIHGDSGTGKELFATLVHDLSNRKGCPFYAINCAALPTELLESELFGHRRGAFTGAISDKAGLFRAAHGGTLFLDEIGEMSPIAQAKLLRVIESGEMRRVGDTQIEKVDVRIVAATNVNLEEAVAQNRFRRDLYYRLKGLEIFLPPLRDRLEDVPLLARHFVKHACSQLGKRLELTFEATQWLLGNAWPGNVRELRLTVERAVALAPESGLLHPYHFMTGPGSQKRQSLSTELEDIERARLINALAVSEWNKTKAAKLLGMSRTTMTGRVKKLGITRPKKN